MANLDKRHFHTEQLRAQNFLGEDERSRRAREQELSYLEGLLGSDAQRNLQAPDPDLAKYQQRFDFDEAAMRSMMKTVGEETDSSSHPDWLRQRVDPFKEASRIKDEANTLLEQAEQAYRAGDISTAEQLREQALEMPSDIPFAFDWDLQNEMGIWEQSWNLTPGEGVRTQAEAAAASPIGQTVGDIVRRGRGLMDRDSQEYQDFYDALTGGALAEAEAGQIMGERAIAAEQRQLGRDIQQQSARRGAARSQYGDRAIMARSAERSALQRANLALQTKTEMARIHAQAGQFLEEFAPSFAANAVSLGRAYAQGSPGIRSQFQNSLSSLAATSAQLASTSAQQHLKAWDLQMRQEALHSEPGPLKKIGLDALSQTTGMVIGALGSGLGSIAGGPIGAALGGSLGNIASSLFGGGGVPGGGATAAGGSPLSNAVAFE